MLYGVDGCATITQGEIKTPPTIVKSLAVSYGKLEYRLGLTASALLVVRIVLPAQIFFIAGGIVRGALMAEGRFGSQAAAPIVYNLCIIVGGVLGAGTLGIAGFAWGALAGAAAGSFGTAMYEARGRVRFAIDDASSHAGG